MNRNGRHSGTVMVELAIVLPLLVLLAFGITELGRALYQESTLTQAVETGARYLARATNAVNSSDCTKGSRWDQLEPIARQLVTCGKDTECDTPLLPDITVDTIDVRATAMGSQPYCIIVVQATAPFHSIFGTDYTLPYSSGGGLTLNAATEERYVVFTN